MANIMTNSVNYSAIASAIRARLGTSEKYKPSQMAQAIMNISGAGGEDFHVLDSFIEGEITEITSNAKTISDYALSFRPNLEKVTAYSATSIGDCAFIMDTAITEINIDGDKIISVGESAFGGVSIESISLSKVETIPLQCFIECKKLKRCDFGAVAQIAEYAMSGCSALEDVIIRTPSVCIINKNAFNNSSIANGTGYVYVPAALINEYKQASCWKSYVNQLRAIEDYPEIAGKIE